jgi:hypothetical protein
MKILFAITVFLISISLYSQQAKQCALIKTTGDTIWCDGVLENGGKTVIAYGGPDGPAIAYPSKEIAFTISGLGLTILDEKGTVWGTVLISGKNYYLSAETAIYQNGAEEIVFHILDKNRKIVERALPGNKSAFDTLRKYFGDCENFKFEIDKAEENYHSKKFYQQIIDLAKKYNC